MRGVCFYLYLSNLFRTRIAPYEDAGYRNERDDSPRSARNAFYAMVGVNPPRNPHLSTPKPCTLAA